MRDRYYWSDRFFNGDWTPTSMNEPEIRKCAKEFLRLFPECPFDENWLVAEFLRRV